MNMDLLKLMLVLAALAGSLAKPTIDMTARLRYCGTRLSTVLGVLCTNFNEPAWDTDEEQGNRVIRSTQQEGVVDECCRTSCSWNHLASYCSKGTVNEETILNHPLLRELYEAKSTHIVSDRSAEAGNDSDSESEVGRSSKLVGSMKRMKGGRVRGALQGEPRGARGCGCRRRRRRRQHRQKSIEPAKHVAGKMIEYAAAERSAPVLGTVSPARTRARLVPVSWSPAVDALFFNYHRK